MKDFSKLKDKTVFDFCTDENVLEEVLPPIPSDSNREQYLKDYWAQNPAQHALSFIDLADATGNDELRKQAERQFEKELSEYFNE